MNSPKIFAVLLAVACVAMLFAGCTTTTTTTIGNPTAAQTAAPAADAPAAPASAGTAAAPAVVVITPACPDTLVWDATWDTRWMSYAGNHDIRVIADGKEGDPDSWNGINAPPATELNLSQSCRDVTGTVAFATDPVCTGTVNGRIEQNQLIGTWKTSGCEPEEKSSDGKFTLTMAADNRSWTGKLIGTPWLDSCSDCPPNWAGRKG